MTEQLVMTDLEGCFSDAIRNEVNYIGVLIQMEGFAEPRPVIDSTANFEAALNHYQKDYNEDLTLKENEYNKIIGFAYGDTFDELEEALEM